MKTRRTTSPTGGAGADGGVRPTSGRYRIEGRTAVRLERGWMGSVHVEIRGLAGNSADAAGDWLRARTDARGDNRVHLV